MAPVSGFLDARDQDVNFSYTHLSYDLSHSYKNKLLNKTDSCSAKIGLLLVSPLVLVGITVIQVAELVTRVALAVILIIPYFLTPKGEITFTRFFEAHFGFSNIGNNMAGVFLVTAPIIKGLCSQDSSSRAVDPQRGLASSRAASTVKLEDPSLSSDQLRVIGRVESYEAKARAIKVEIEGELEAEKETLPQIIKIVDGTEESQFEKIEPLIGRLAQLVRFCEEKSQAAFYQAREGDAIANGHFKSTQAQDIAKRANTIAKTAQDLFVTAQGLYQQAVHKSTTVAYGYFKGFEDIVSANLDAERSRNPIPSLGQESRQTPTQRSQQELYTEAYAAYTKLLSYEESPFREHVKHSVKTAGEQLNKLYRLQRNGFI